MDKSLNDALEAQARGVVDVIITLATVRDERWSDALDAFGPAFEKAKREKLARVKEARARRGDK